MAEIDFNCPYCGQQLNGPDNMAGQTINCPVCNKSFQIPGGIAETSTPQPFPSFVTPLNGEQILSVTHPSWLYFLGKFVFGGLSLLIGIICLIAGARTESPVATIGMLVTVLGLLYTICITVKMLLFTYSQLYVMTNYRVVAKKGLISVSTSEVRISDIRGTNLRQGIWERILDVGSIAIGSAATAGTEIHFNGIRKPRHVLAVINAQRKA